MPALGQQKHDLLATEILSFETRLSAMEIREHVAFLKLPFERLNHLCTDLPILIPANAARNLRFLNPNVRDDRDRSVILPQITERRPIVVILRANTRRQHEKHEKGFE